MLQLATHRYPHSSLTLVVIHSVPQHTSTRHSHSMSFTLHSSIHALVTHTRYHSLCTVAYMHSSLTLVVIHSAQQHTSTRHSYSLSFTLHSSIHALVTHTRCHSLCTVAYNYSPFISHPRSLLALVVFHSAQWNISTCHSALTFYSYISYCYSTLHCSIHVHSLFTLIVIHSQQHAITQVSF